MTTLSVPMAKATVEEEQLKEDAAKAHKCKGSNHKECSD